MRKVTKKQRQFREPNLEYFINVKLNLQLEVAMNRSNNNDCRVYVGNLPQDVREKDLESVFYKYGHIADIDLKNRRGGPPFAFVEFDDPR